MSSATLHGLFDIGSTSHALPTPAPTLQKSKNHARREPSPTELDEYTFGKGYNGPSDVTSGQQSSSHPAPLITERPHETSPPPEATVPKTPNELEMSRPPSPRAVGLMQSWRDPPINKWRVLSCCLMYFVNGLTDSATGALIPYMETHYNIGFAVMSLIFVGQALGFILAAFFNNAILSKLGRAKMLVLSELLMVAAYIILVCTPPYALVIVAFFLIGYGMAITLALNNVFVSNLHPPSVVSGAAHGSYGIGGIIAPIAATALASRGMLWSRFYFLPFGLGVCAMVCAGWFFWDYKEDSPETLLTALERTVSRQAAHSENEAPVSKLRDLKLALKNRTSIFGALFIFAYQGAEVSISGWVISFLIQYRGGDPGSVGYVTAGFWVGITLGRFILVHLTPRFFSERPFITALILGTMLFQLLTYLIPSVVSNAVSVAILGLLLGPVYPCVQTIFTRLMPRGVQTTAIGFIASAGSAGGAVAPFTVGILAQAVGTFVLHPVCLGLYVVMLVSFLWGLPRVGKRRE